MSLDGVAFSEMRTDPSMRDDFLTELAARNRSKICGILQEVRRAVLDVDDATQAFLVAANAAIDTARTEDDGRGENDPEAWCAWRGILAVKDAVRNAWGRQGRACYRQRAERRLIYTGALSEMMNENEAGSMYYADPNDYADDTIANVCFEQFLGDLEGFDRDLALLLVFGETETLSLKCSCTGSPHSYIHDLATTLGVSQNRVFKGIRRLRDACSQSAA